MKYTLMSNIFAGANMFWQSHVATSASVDQLLDKEDATLEQLLDEDDVIQECKAQNSKVVEFLTRPEVLSALVERLVTEPPAGAELTTQYRHPNLACEVVQCAIPAVLDRLASDRALLDRLCAPLHQPTPLNPLLASFLSRTLSLLLARRTDQVLEYLRSQEQFVDHILQHLATSAIMDLLCHLVSGIEDTEPRQATFTWLTERRLVPRLALLVGDAEQPERQANAAVVLTAAIACGRQLAMQQAPDEREPNPLLASIESEEFVSSLVDAVLAGGRTEAGLVNAIHVLLPLLDPGVVAPTVSATGLSSEDATPTGGDPPCVSVAVSALLSRLPALHQTLVSPPARPDLVTSWGRLSPPLGATRLQVARLIVALLATGRPAVRAQLAALGTVDVLLDLFFHFTLNNFLHSQVEQCVSLILESAPQETEDASSHPLLEQLFTTSRLIQRILQGMEEKDATTEKCDENRCWRSLRGYGGHLISMANKVVAAMDSGPNSELLRRLIDQLPEHVRSGWHSFTDTQLPRINELNRPVVMPDQRHDSSSDSDFRGVSESQQFTAALMKAMGDSSSGGLPDAFGRADDEFRDLSSGLGPLGAAGLLSLAAEAESRPGASELFEQHCAERLGGLGGPVGSAGWPSHGVSSSSSDEDEDEEEGEDGRLRMEVDTSDPWASAPAAADAGDPWGASSGAADSSDPWATSPPSSTEANVWQSAPAADLSAERDWANFDAFSAPSARPPSPPLLPPPAAALQGVSPDSQSSPGVAPPRPPGSGSPHFPVDFNSGDAFGSAVGSVPMVTSPPRPDTDSSADPSGAVSDRLTPQQSASSDGGSGAVSSAQSGPAGPDSPRMDVSSEGTGSATSADSGAPVTGSESGSTLTD
ncbi:serine/threonine-protein phosphatase 6 regulatory subunit 3-like isoform X2 [Amphibalanus amphitrite]|uniref:serine/threonine-protein phosphatase 6 regulatory subunit 3-like isoform X2 n=2 Tax=Amphibalanus amphitrite TaxID=1232801 RepID=UPI001C903A11|nr:serine/threonine-protein phosphatase 6 regulatory subunit 3-like isoform X2 [Amphibalanus amphitrite]